MLVVTGGSKGIGKALIMKFAANGHAVAACARNAEGLSALKAEVAAKFGTEVYIQTANLAVKAQAEAFTSFVLRCGQPVDILVNNAGSFLPGQLHSEPDGTLEAMIETNLYSAYYVTKGLVDGMIGRKQGHIFNICSVASIQAYPNGGAYAVSKHAMLGFSRCLREELKPDNIRVTSVMPGAAYTDSWSASGLPPERFMRAEDIAEMVYAAYTVGKTADVEDIVMRPPLGDI